MSLRSVDSVLLHFVQCILAESALFVEKEYRNGCFFSIHFVGLILRLPEGVIGVVLFGQTAPLGERLLHRCVELLILGLRGYVNLFFSVRRSFSA